MQSTAFVQYPRVRAHAGELFSGPKPHWLSELDLWGPISHVEVLKIEVPYAGSKPFAQGESGSCEFPPGFVTLPRVDFMVRL